MPESLIGVPNKYIDKNGVQWTYSRCHFCHMNCGIMIGVDTKTEKIVEIRGNEKEGTVLCDRMGQNGQKAIQMHYHPKRINHPLKRVGKRGEDRWVQISYDQALDEIAEKLAEIKEKYGPEALVASEGTYRSEHLWARTRFFNLFGNPGNVVDPGTICWCYNYTVNMAMTGWPIESMSPISYDDTQTFVVWGKRVSECYGPQSPMWRSYLRALARKENTPKLIQVDPTCTAQSIIADHWLALYPGTDLIMMLAWANYIVFNELYDEAFLKAWTNSVFLVRESDKQLLRTADVFGADGNTDDFVVWDAHRESVGKWNSNENRYYDEDVDAALYGQYQVKLASGEEVACITVFEALKAHVAEYSVERAAEITGCRESQIIAAAYTYATNGAAFIGWGLGGGDQHGPNAAATAIAKTILRILCGNIDIPGGEYVGEPGPLPGLDGIKTFPMRDAELEMSELVTPECRDKFIGVDQFKIMSWRGFEPIDKCYRKMFGVPRPMLHQMLSSPTLVWDAILKDEPYPVKAMICWSSNPLCWAPNTKHVYEALKGLELLVVCEYWKTPTAAIADYIMPAADCLERPMCSTSEDSNDFSVIGDRGSKPLYERRMDYDFFRALACRLGQEEYWPWETYEEVIEHRIERVPDLDYTKAVEEGTYFPSPTRYYKYLDTLANGETRGFATPSRKCEIMPSVIQDLGYEALPVYRELPETPLSNPELAREYPLRLAVAGRVSTLYHSEFRVPGQGTRSMHPWPTVHINLEDARDLDIRDGDWVWIETLRGRIRQKAKVDAGILRGFVQAQPSWWFPELPAEEPWSQGLFESGGNVLTDDAVETLDKGTATWVTRGLLCKVYPCIDPSERIDTYTTGEDFHKGNSYFDKAFEPLKAWRIES